MAISLAVTTWLCLCSCMLFPLVLGYVRSGPIPTSRIRGRLCSHKPNGVLQLGSSSLSIMKEDVPSSSKKDSNYIQLRVAVSKFSKLFLGMISKWENRGTSGVKYKLKKFLLMTTLPLILALRRVSPSHAATLVNGGRNSAEVNRPCDRTQGARRTHSSNKARVVIEVKDESSEAGTSFSLEKRTKVNLGELKSALQDTETEVTQTWKKLLTSMEGTKLDALILFVATSVVIPLFKKLKKSSILGFLLTGTLLGPNGLNWLKDIHRIDVLGELGVVFFLFEMGLDLSLERLRAMKKDVFGLGTTTFLGTTLIGTVLSQLCGLPLAASIAISSSLSLSSSAFVLQLLKDKDAMNARYGQAAFGILLLQDLAVVPVLVVIELLSGPSAAIGKALTVAAVKAAVTLSTMSVVGRKILDPLFKFVARSNSEEAFISIILSTVLLMSFVTQGIGLSNTLGAFLAGLLLAETHYRYQVEADIAPYRGVLLGFFFITVGFSIDLRLLIREAPRIFAILGAMVATKASVITLSSLMFGLKLGPALQTGLLNSQGGEFAFVAFAVAERSGLIPASLKKILLTSVALSMAATPALAGFGEFVAHHLESRNTGLPVGSSAVSASSAVTVDGAVKHRPDPQQSSGSGTVMKEDEGFVLVLGYGRVGKMVCDMLERKHIKYVAIDNSPKRTIEARNRGLPVFYGDVNRPEVLKYFKASKAATCVLTIDDIQATNKAIITIRKNFSDLPVIVRAENQQHKERIETLYPEIRAMCPMLPEDSLILTLPFGGAVLESMGVNHAEVESIVDEFGKEYMDHEGVKDFFTRFQRRLPPSAVPSKNELLDSFDTSPLDVLTEETSEETSLEEVPIIGEGE